MEEVVEGRFEDVGRADVGGEGLVVAGCRTMERLDGARGVDTIRTGVLRAGLVSHVLGETREKSRTRSRRSTAFWYSRSSRSNSGHMSSHVPRKLVASSSRIGLRGSGIRPRLMSDAR